MCTVSWRREAGDGYTLYFNRDESRERARALPPAVHETPEGVRYLAGTDPDAGGTWLAVNEYGVSVGVLNFYDAQPPRLPADPVSRGTLVSRLAGSRDLSDVEEFWAGDEGRRHAEVCRPFLLFATDTCGGASLWRWDGERLAVSEPGLPLTTSSYLTEAVLEFRRKVYLGLEGDLRAFHQRHDADLPRHSPLMARPDARTVSVSEVEVGARIIRWRYWEPDENVALCEIVPVIELERRSVEAS